MSRIMKLIERQVARRDYELWPLLDFPGDLFHAKALGIVVIDEEDLPQAMSDTVSKLGEPYEQQDRRSDSES